MQLYINGEAVKLSAEHQHLSLQALLGVLGLEGKRIALELNQTIVPRSCYAETFLQAGDTLEVIHAVGGG